MIAVAATSFPRRPGDLAGAFVLDLSEALAARGASLHHIVPGAPDVPMAESLGATISVRRAVYGQRFGLDRLTYGDGIEANLRKRPWLLAGVPLLGRAMKVAFRECLARSPECLLSHWIFPTAYWLAPMAARAELPHIVCEHGGGVQLLARLPGGRRIFRRVCRSVDEIVFVSRDLEEKGARLLGERWPCRTSVRSMGVDRAVFEEKDSREKVRRARLGEDHQETFVVLSVGRLVALKGHDLLIRAVAGVERTELWIAGEGPERRSLEELARSMGSKVRFLGSIDRREIPREYTAADLFGLASRPTDGGRTEGAPVAIAEALAAKRAIVATETGGIADRVKNGVSGILVPIEDVDALRRAIISLRDDPAFRARLESGASREAEANDVDVVAAHFAEVIDWAVRKRR